MRYPEKHYHWEWELQSSPADLWPLVADTNRFDRDAGSPKLELLEAGTSRLTNARQRLRQVKFGVPLEYVQEPYEWIYPSRYGVVRRYSAGPLAELRVLAELTPRADGGSHVDYHVWVRARTLIGWMGIPVQVGILFARSFEASFRRFDKIVAGGKPTFVATDHAEFVRGGRRRMEAARRTLLDQGADPDLLAQLINVIETGDSTALARMRPYALADTWGVNRRDVLKLCLLATRYGLLDFRWDLLCPLCRGPKFTSPTLGGLQNRVHCDVCNIDFTANFEQSVELTFRPNPAIRTIEEALYCVGGPTLTPHIVVQQLLAPGDRRTLTPTLEPGRYRVRTLGLRGGQMVSVTPEGWAEVSLRAAEDGWPDEEWPVSLTPTLEFRNETAGEQLFVLERIAWTDQATTAAEVTMLQMFRDLFASEALRPGEQISVGQLAMAFTDLRGSTGLYRQIGDAPAFGLVMDHFDVLRDAILAENGVIVKTIGDAVMAAFRQPAAALRAMLDAQRRLADPPPDRQPLLLKAGIHFGPCIAVSLNDRLDYFGSTVNIAARLEAISRGDNVIVSSAVYHDPEVAEMLADPACGLTAVPMRATLKGFEDEFELWSIHAAR